MALEDAITPDVKPLGSPAGRFQNSPLADTTQGDLTSVDPLAGEGASSRNSGYLVDTTLNAVSYTHLTLPTNREV